MAMRHLLVLLALFASAFAPYTSRREPHNGGYSPDYEFATEPTDDRGYGQPVREYGGSRRETNYYNTGGGASTAPPRSQNGGQSEWRYRDEEEELQQRMMALAVYDKKKKKEDDYLDLAYGDDEEVDKYPATLADIAGTWDNAKYYTTRRADLLANLINNLRVRYVDISTSGDKISFESSYGIKIKDLKEEEKKTYKFHEWAIDYLWYMTKLGPKLSFSFRVCGVPLALHHQFAMTENHSLVMQYSISAFEFLEMPLYDVVFEKLPQRPPFVPNTDMRRLATVANTVMPILNKVKPILKSISKLHSK